MRPEGYRKSIRLMELANKFNIPIITFIDTPGAYPGVGAEERGQAEAIARSIESLYEIKSSKYFNYYWRRWIWRRNSISFSKQSNNVRKCNLFCYIPRGMCNNIMERSKKTLEAAQAMKLTSKELLDLKIVDEIIDEPIGGAHRDREKTLENIKISIQKNLEYFENLSEDEIIFWEKQ